MDKKKTVGLIVLANIQDHGLVAALQVRGDFNSEKDNQETYRGASQLTLHGSINEGETEKEALLREAKEELGEEFANLIQGKALDLEELNRTEDEKISVINFSFRIAEKDLDKIKINERTGASIRLIVKDEIKNIRELKLTEKLNGIENKNDIAMFPDDIEAVKLAFEKI